MLSQTFEPLELVPAAAMPSSEILGAGRSQTLPSYSDRSYSDIFPQDSYHDFESAIGNYIGGDPKQGHPLYAVMQGLYAAYYDFAAGTR